MVCRPRRELTLTPLVSVSPGSIIRCMRRLEEVLRQMCSAAKAIGNTELENKFAEGDESSPNIWQEKYSLIWEEWTWARSSRAPASHLEMFVSDDDMLARC